VDLDKKRNTTVAKQREQQTKIKLKHLTVWNSLPDEIDFSTVKSFACTIKRVIFNDFVRYS